MFGWFAVHRLSGPSGSGGEKPSDTGLATRALVVHHSRAMDLIRVQRHAGFLGGLADSRAEGVLTHFDMP